MIAPPTPRSLLVLGGARSGKSRLAQAVAEMSAASPVMNRARNGRISFLVHTFAVSGGELRFTAPERLEVTLPDEPGQERAAPSPEAGRAASPAIGSTDPGRRK